MVEGCLADDVESEGGEETQNEEGEAEDVRVGGRGEDGGADGVGHCCGRGVSFGWMDAAGLREVLGAGDCGTGSCEMQCWGTRSSLRERKTMPTHNALSALVARASFVSDHGDCAFRQ